MIKSHDKPRPITSQWQDLWRPERKTHMLPMEWFIRCWYVLAQCDLIPRINYFRVGQFDWMSDHAFISTDVAVDIAKYKDIPSEWKKVNRQMQNWDTESKEKIREILDSPSFKIKLDNFCNMQYVSSSEAAAELTFIIQDAVKRVFPRKIKHRKSRKLKSSTGLPI